VVPETIYHGELFETSPHFLARVPWRNESWTWGPEDLEPFLKIDTHFHLNAFRQDSYLEAYTVYYIYMYLYMLSIKGPRVPIIIWYIIYLLVKRIKLWFLRQSITGNCLRQVPIFWQGSPEEMSNGIYLRKWVMAYIWGNESWHISEEMSHGHGDLGTWDSS